MKRLLTLAAAFVLFFGISDGQKLHAQVYGDFSLELRENKSFEPIDDKQEGVRVYSANEFWMNPTRQRDRDNGYVAVGLPFKFSFSGVSYDSIYVCVNGFATFVNPPNVAATDPQGLFKIENSYPDNVLAPFWGDHMYRTAEDNDILPAGANRWQPTKILVWKTNDKVVIEWKDLNILDKGITSSVATFQIILYKSIDPNSNQGDVEFAYGTAGKRPGQATSDTRVVTTGASIGIKGEFGVLHSNADFINALWFASSQKDQTSKITYTNQWQPTTGSDKRFAFAAFVRHIDSDQWGDGDADMSKIIGGKHFDLRFQQNRFVTVNDARTIMVSVAHDVPLDSIKGRAAFHGDVNHDGRFVYDINGVKHLIKKRSKEYNQDLPMSIIGSEKQVMFSANEYDAAIILHYLGVRIPYLPWIIDTILTYGKQEATVNNNIMFGTPEVANNGNVTLPVLMNGYVDGPISAKFNVNGEIESIVNISKDNFMSMHNNSHAVLAGTGKFNSGEAIAYVTYRPNSKGVVVNNLYYNGEEYNDVVLNTIEGDSKLNNSLLSNYPNPFTTSTNIAVTFENPGYYTLNIYDINGNLVKSLFNGNISKSSVVPFAWDGSDNAGIKVGSGMYIYRLTGNNVSVSNTMQLVK